jgi:hypothetical protein
LRYDYEEVDSKAANELYSTLFNTISDPSFTGREFNGFVVDYADDFSNNILIYFRLH